MASVAGGVGGFARRSRDLFADAGRIPVPRFVDKPCDSMDGDGRAEGADPPDMGRLREGLRGCFVLRVHGASAKPSVDVVRRALGGARVRPGGILRPSVHPQRGYRQACARRIVAGRPGRVLRVRLLDGDLAVVHPPRLRHVRRVLCAGGVCHLHSGDSLAEGNAILHWVDRDRMRDRSCRKRDIPWPSSSCSSRYSTS